MEQYFQDMVTSDDDYPRKPDPAGLLTLLKRYDLPPESTLIIGDREIDIQAGKNAGVATCFYSPKPGGNSADCQFQDYFELIGWLTRE